MQQLFKQMGMGLPGEGGGGHVSADAGEQVHVSPLALVKMLKHGRAGVPMEVMGLMLGEFVNEYSIIVVDVFSMPQTGNNVSVEAVDPVYQTEMLEQLRMTGRPEMVVGWYHSHPGFGCWFSGTDINTQQSFEQLNNRAVGVVVDPIQSVRGKVVMDCFRLISPNILMLGQEPRQTTSNVGFLNKPSGAALARGLNRSYYSININCRTTIDVANMLTAIHTPLWTEPLQLKKYTEEVKETSELMEEIRDLSKDYSKSILAEKGLKKRETIIKRAGKIDDKKRLLANVDTLLTSTVINTVTSAVNVGVFGLEAATRNL